MNRKQRRATAKVGQTSSYPGATAATAATLGAAELLRAGLEHHQAGRLAEAETYYLRVLAADPRHADALYLLGVVAHGLTDQIDREVGSAHLPCYDRALALKPDYVEAWNNRGCALQAMKRLDQALASFGQALALKPDYAEAFFNRGVTLRQLKRSEAGAAAGPRPVA